MKLPRRILHEIEAAGGSIETHLLLPDVDKKSKQARISDLIRDGYVVRLYKITDEGIARIGKPDKREPKTQSRWGPAVDLEDPLRYPLVDLKDIDLLKAEAEAARTLRPE